MNHWRQIVLRVVGKLRVQKRTCDDRSRARNEQCVTVRQCLGDDLGCYIAGSACPVIDNCWLSPSLVQLLSYQPGGGISACARRKPDDHP